MATILDLFKSRQEEVYGKVDNIRINSRGFINPPRGAALLASSPNAVADLIGNQVSGVLKGNANRPSDTIFRNNLPFTKPITLGATQAQVRDRVQPDTNYFIKDNPSPASVFARIEQGGSTNAGVVANLAIGAINKFGSKKGLENLKNYKKKLFSERGDELYGPKFSKDKKPTKVKKQDKFFSKYFRDEEGKLTERNNTLFQNWDLAQNEINKKDSFNDAGLEDFLKNPKNKNHVFVLFKKYGDSITIPFIGAVTGISEDISPEWNGFRYIGSPFKVYRYSGVERSLKFELKLYYTTSEEKVSMIKKLNYLKSLTFPYEQISEMKYGQGTDIQTSQYAFSPNLVYLTIGDLYKNTFGFIESLSFNIEDNTTWPALNTDTPPNSRADELIYPSVVDASISMKIIENHKTETGGGITRYKYNFDGNNEKETYTIK